MLSLSHLLPNKHFIVVTPRFCTPHSPAPTSSLVFFSCLPSSTLTVPVHQAADLWLDYSSDSASSTQQQTHGNPLALPLQVRPGRGSTSVMDWLASRVAPKGV